MTWLDYALLGVIVVSVAWGAWRGFAREAVSLAGWVVAFVVANLFAGQVGEMLPDSLGRAELRVLASFVAIFLVALAVTTLAGLLLSKLLKAAGLSGLDRTLGGIFGLARALVLAVAFALVAGLTTFPGHPIWKESVSGPHLAQAALAVRGWLPPAFASRLRYH
jgi:membrane protein required for colicin V production